MRLTSHGEITISTIKGHMYQYLALALVLKMENRYEVFRILYRRRI